MTKVKTELERGGVSLALNLGQRMILRANPELAKERARPGSDARLSEKGLLGVALSAKAQTMRRRVQWDAGNTAATGGTAVALDLRREIRPRKSRVLSLRAPASVRTRF